MKKDLKMETHELRQDLLYGEIEAICELILFLYFINFTVLGLFKDLILDSSDCSSSLQKYDIDCVNYCNCQKYHNSNHPNKNGNWFTYQANNF